MNDIVDAPDQLVDTVEAARLLGLKPNTLNKARVYGGVGGLRFVKLGRSVKYSTREIARHVALHTYASTGEVSGY